METNQPTNEFDAPRWSILTFDDHIAGGLTYEEAADFVIKHKGKLIGLCIVTDEAASRLHNIKTAEKLQRERQADIPKPITFSDTL